MAQMGRGWGLQAAGLHFWIQGPATPIGESVVVLRCISHVILLFLIYGMIWHDGSESKYFTDLLGENVVKPQTNYR